MNGAGVGQVRQSEDESEPFVCRILKKISSSPIETLTHVSASAHRGCRCLIPWSVGLQVAVSQLMGVLGTELRFSGRASGALA